MAWKVDSQQQELRDARDLAVVGHSQALSRKFTLLSMLSLAFCVLGTWMTCAMSFASGLLSGGPISILWGLVFVASCNLCVATSLAEICSAIPTALGQAYWISQLLKTPSGRFASYMCAWINTLGWWTLAASQMAFMTDFLLDIKFIFDPNWTGIRKGWMRFLVYVAMTIASTIFNLLACRKEKILPAFSNLVGVCFIVLFLAFIIALPLSVARNSELNFQSTSFVFRAWLNHTGWADGLTWFLGLVQGAYSLTAFDSVVHMVEEIPNPRRNAPIAMCLAVLLGAVSGYVFMLVCLFCVQDLSRMLAQPSEFPFLELVRSTIGVKGGAILIVPFTFCGICQGIAIITSASRLTWSFARDGGIPFGSYFSRVDKHWKVPCRALYLQAVLISLIGLLYFFADAVLQAILSVSTIGLTISYGAPICALLVAGRDAMPPSEFRLGKMGPIINWISVTYSLLATIFFFFPSHPSPGIEEMNYAIVVFGLMLIFALGFWFAQGRKRYMMMGCEEE